MENRSIRRRRRATAMAATAVAVAAAYVAFPTLARAALLDPNSSIFNANVAANGALNLTGSGALNINTSTGTILFAPASGPAVQYTGVSVSQDPDFNPVIAAFAFSTINIGPNVTISVTGSNPLALLSRGNMTLAANIDVGGRTTPVAGGAAGGGNNANGSGPGGGGIVPVTFGLPAGGNGGGFGGAGGRGGSNVANTAVTGIPYGDLLTALQAGSGGAGGSGTTASFGGAGGGALELGAAGALTLSGSVTANGGGGVGSSFANPGAGSGGGVLLHAATVNVTSVSAAGGNALGGALVPSGGGGGGGRVAVTVPSYTAGSAAPVLSVSVAGGAGGAPSLLDGRPGGAGAPGSADLYITSANVPAGKFLDLSSINGLTPHLAGDLFVAGIVLAPGTPQGPGLPNLYTNTASVAVVNTGVYSAGFSLNNAAGGSWSMNGGAVLAPGNFDLSHSSAQGYGTINARIAGDPTATLRAATQTLTAGDPNRTDAVHFDGAIDVTSGAQLILLSQDHALIGNTTLADASKLSAPNGTTLRAARTLTAAGNATISGDFTNDGTVAGPAAPGAALTFADDVDGPGNFTGHVTFSNLFSPGKSPARVSLESATFDPTSSLMIDLLGPAPGAGYDQLAVTGDLLLTGGTLQLNPDPAFTPAPGSQFEIIDLTGTRTGTFAGLPQGALVATLNHVPLHITYAAGDGNDVALVTPIPEPAPATLTLLLATTLLTRRRRRHHRAITRGD